MARKIHISFLKNNFLFFANFVPIFIFSFNFITIFLTIHCLETICSLFGNESLWSKLNRISQSWSNNKRTQNWNTFQSNPLSLYPFCRSRSDGNREYEREREKHQPRNNAYCRHYRHHHSTSIHISLSANLHGFHHRRSSFFISLISLSPYKPSLSLLTSHHG